jgi:hypothetical protein
MVEAMTRTSTPTVLFLLALSAFAPAVDQRGPTIKDTCKNTFS